MVPMGMGEQEEDLLLRIIDQQIAQRPDSGAGIQHGDVLPAVDVVSALDGDAGRIASVSARGRAAGGNGAAYAPEFDFDRRFYVSFYFIHWYRPSPRLRNKLYLFRRAKASPGSGMLQRSHSTNCLLHTYCLLHTAGAELLRELESRAGWGGVTGN